MRENPAIPNPTTTKCETIYRRLESLEEPLISTKGDFLKLLNTTAPQKHSMKGVVGPVTKINGSEPIYTTSSRNPTHFREAIVVGKKKGKDWSWRC